MVNIKLLFVILDEGYNNKIKLFFNKYGIRVKFATYAIGTASPSILSYFGLMETEKEVFMAIIPDYLSRTILEKLESNFNLKKEGTGIAFTIPITSSNKYLSDVYNKTNSDRSENISMEKRIDYHLIFTIVSEGYLEQVMSAAKKSGCSGGTAIKGRSLSNSTRAKILGFNIESEKDIILNLVSKNEKTKVMEEITKEVGIKSNAKGLCFSLPVDEVVGFNLSEDNEVVR